MGRMIKMFRTLREENESVVQLKGICPDGKVPKGLLLEGKKAIEDELVDRSKVFTNAKKLDQMNEAMPNSPSTASSGSGNFLHWKRLAGSFGEPQKHLWPSMSCIDWNIYLHNKTYIQSIVIFPYYFYHIQYLMNNFLITNS